MIGYTYTMYLNFLLGFLVTRLNCLEMNFPVQNNRPVIGILSQDYYGNFKDYGDQSSYIAASYVKYIESAGGRVVPILVSQDGDYYRQLFRNINGLLLPGGGQFLNNSTYAEAGKIMYDLAVTANLEHDYFPIWGTCLGFELMSILAANGTSPLVRCRGWDVDGPINFLEEYEDLKNSSRMFKDLSFDLYQIMRTEKVAINYHRKCITTQDFQTFRLDGFFDVLAIDVDKDGLEYVAAFEAKHFPFYGVQWHPEKNMFEFNLRKGHVNTPHDCNAIRASQYFANFFVNEARKSGHFFDLNTERANLIYNYKPEYTYQHSDYEQMYFFKSSTVRVNSCSFFTYILFIVSMTMCFE